MARMLDDASRAKMLASMIDNYGTEEQDQGATFPTSSRTPVPAMAPAGSENPNREDEQEMINQKMGVEGSTRMPAGMQPIPGTNMVAVPAPLAHSAMQMLMQQASLNSVGKSYGADGGDMRDVRGGFPRKPGDLEGAEVEGDEDVGHNRGPVFPDEEQDEDPTTNQIRRRVTPDRKPARR